MARAQELDPKVKHRAGKLGEAACKMRLARGLAQLRARLNEDELEP